MGKLQQQLIEVLECDIGEWESIAAYFENVPADSFVQGLGVTCGKEKAKQIRGRIEAHRKLIREVEQSN